MKITLITGSHPRHLYLANLLKENGLLEAAIIQKRETFVPKPTPDLSADLKAFYELHFLKRKQAEEEIFNSSSCNFTFSNIKYINPEDLNTKDTIKFLGSVKSDLVITAGVGILLPEFLAAAPREVWNIHGGLSPWYKGAITHFWPSYHLQPQYTGCTIHLITQKIDGGPVIHQTPAVLDYGDGLHQLSCRSLELAFQELIPLLNKRKKTGPLKTQLQRSTGKLWLKSDWQPEHLSLIYGLYSDKIVNAFLDQNVQKKFPVLYRQKL